MKKVTFETKIMRSVPPWYSNLNDSFYLVGESLRFCSPGWHRLTKFKIKPGVTQRVRITITPIKSAKKKKVT